MARHEPLRIAIVGCGFVGRIHSMVLLGLRRAGYTEASVVACCDADVERARRFAVFHGSSVATSDAAQAMAAADAVWICTPTSTHRGLMDLACSLRLPVYCEKPLAPTLSEAEDLAAAAAAAGIPVQVGLVLRSSTVLVAARHRVLSGELGRLMAIVFRDDQYFPIQGQYASSWRSEVSIAGGGTLLEHSIHDLDVLQWIGGPVRSVSAGTANFAAHEGIEDVAAVTLVHDSGAISTLTSVWHSIMSRPSTRRVEVFCERGLLWTNDEAGGPLYLQTDDGVTEVSLAERTQGGGSRPEEGVIRVLRLPPELEAPLSLYIRSDLAFLDSLASRKMPSPGLEPALDAHRLADLAYRCGALRNAQQLATDAEQSSAHLNVESDERPG